MFILTRENEFVKVNDGARIGRNESGWFVTYPDNTSLEIIRIEPDDHKDRQIMRMIADAIKTGVLDLSALDNEVAEKIQLTPEQVRSMHSAGSVKRGT